MATPVASWRTIADSGGLTERAVARATNVAALLFGSPAQRDFNVRYWNGAEERAGQLPPAFTLVVRNGSAFRRMCTPLSELALGEAFVRGDIDIVGNLEAAAAAGDRVASRVASAPMLARLAFAALRLPRSDAAPLGRLLPWAHRHGGRHTPARDSAAVRAHYDVGNEFYGLWLDRSLTYSCAYFETGAEDLNTAQAMKLEHVCRKLRLTPGERLLDVGCGWGALVRYAARHYGVEAEGITLSEQQADWARARIRFEGLQDRCQVVVSDYRAHRSAPFDKIVSIGMVEHVGRARLGEYFGRLFALLRPGGVLLNHGIVAAPLSWRTAWRERVLWRRGAFIDRYVFPDGELVPLGERMSTAEAAGFEIRDVETLREHYVLTLRQWGRRLEQSRAAAESIVGARLYRVWRLYMAASAYAFDCGRLSVAQVVYGRRTVSGHVALPLTRRDLYQQEA